MIAGRCIGAVFALLLACGPRGTAAPDGEVRGEEAAADAAEQRGATDVAAAWRGRAFVRAPTVARMDAWIDALVAGGEVSRAREGLAEAMTAALARRDFKLYNAGARRLRGLPAAREEGIAVTELAPGLAAAYAAEAAGRWRAAATAFAAAGSDAPVHLARAGEVYAALDDMVEARRRWAGARAGFHARGAAIELVPMRWREAAAGWRGEVLTSWAWGESLLDGGRRAPRFAWLRGVGARGLAVVGAYAAVAFTADGREFVVAEGDRLVLRDVASGLVRREIGEVEEVPETILTSGTGEDLRVLASGAPTTLWDRHGRLVASFPLPPDPVDPDAVASAVAMTAGAAQVAVGGHGGTVRVFAGGRGVTLSERTPDRNAVRALGFDRAGRLVAVHDRGDLVGWDVRSGARLWHHALCSPARDECPQNARASVSADGSTVVFGPHAGVFSEVSAADGRVLRRLADAWTAGAEVVHSPAGAVGLIGGAATVWRPGAVTPERGPPSSPRRSRGTWLSRDGRVLYGPGSANHRGPDVVWDVVAGRRLPVTRDAQERILAMRADGRRAAVRTRTEIEVRDTDTGAVVATVDLVGGGDVHLPGSGHVVVRRSRERQWVIVEPGGRRSVHASDEKVLAVSDDGGWIASEGPGPDGVLAVNVRRLAAPAEVVHVLGFHADELVFTRDGTRVAWIERPARANGRTKVHVRSLVGEPAPAEVSLAELASGLAFGDEEREVWFVAPGWTRWRPDTGALTEVDLPGGPVLGVTSDGRTIQVRGIAETRLFRAGARPLEIGQLVALDSGEWLARSAAGAIDGSPGAADGVITWVQQGSTDMVFDGRLGWDAAHVDGLVGRLLAGEDVAPPVRMRRATRR